MSAKMEAIAVVILLMGVVLVATIDTAFVGGLLVAGGAYALVLPAFIEPQHPTGK